MLNYDPDGTPDVNLDALHEAERLGMRPIHVICDEPGAQVGDSGCVSFMAFVHFVPRVGEIIQLEDGTHCRVHKVHYKITNVNGFISMMPNVDALRISPE
ncbi:hypothetical protein [Gimesia maris]|uniref:Uncharacterized protein n=1 Tax=Gimesia maris TaxID=122 RepID=A0ABX5YIV5_9PLAN|nr:hypothetical protein [Gimesia maris]EDL58259.1 hypothetical protein PM8797T_17027 [Gimesia maris DSM 8797]QEG15535.1 hypothetical protein GmarT_13760 [Gimesia maris]QGQ31167.1 hypothetical protein F1729_22415 [Gimesia maris]